MLMREQMERNLCYTLNRPKESFVIEGTDKTKFLLYWERLKRNLCT